MKKSPLSKLMDTTAGMIGVGLVFIVVGVAFLVFPFPSGVVGELKFRLVGVFMLVVGAFAVVAPLYRMVFPTAIDRSERAAERRAQSLVKTGRAMPLPPTPKQLPAIAKSSVSQSRNWAFQMRQLADRWRKQGIPTSATRPTNFEDVLATVRKVTGNWNELAEPLDTFGDMPAPWRWIGAAEIIRLLAYVQGRTFITSAIRQGLRFIAEAQSVDPRNVEALLTRVTLLTCTDDVQWTHMALETLTIARQVAPTHPRLPLAEIDYYIRIGDFNQALAANDRLVAQAATPEEANRRRMYRANLLMEAERNDEAAAAFAEIAPAFPENPWLWHNYSIVLRRLKRYDEALEVSDLALSIMEFGTGRNNNNWLRAQLGKPATIFKV